MSSETGYRRSVIEREAQRELDSDWPLIEVDVSAATFTYAPEPQYVIKPWVPRKVATLLGAHGGLGKSTLALVWCAHVAAGRNWAGCRVECGTAVFVSLEDPAEVVVWRLRKIVACYGLSWADVEARIRILDGTHIEAALMTEVNDHGTRALVSTKVMGQVEKAAEGAALVVVDNASDGFDGDENNRRQVRSFVRRLAHIAQDNGAGLVLLAHIDKAAARMGGKGNSYSGSTAWHNSVRSRVAMVEEEKTGVILLTQEKLNLGKKADSLSLSWSDTGVLIPYKVESGMREEAATRQLADDADAVLEILQTAERAGIKIPTAKQGSRTTWHALIEFPELGAAYRNPTGRRRVMAALVALERSKRISRLEYRKPDRHAGERWAVINAGGIVA